MQLDFFSVKSTIILYKWWHCQLHMKIKVSICGCQRLNWTHNVNTWVQHQLFDRFTYYLYSVKMKNTEKGNITGLKSPSKEKSSNPYDKQSFGEGNIYSNTYRDTSKSFIGIYKIFLRWKGSVYRLVWHDLILFMTAYFILLIIYRVVLIHFPTHKQHFELMCIYAHRFSSAIPITFLTGFYVSSVVSRWWDQFMSLPYPDQLALKLVAYVPGNVSWVVGPQIY